MLTDTGPLIALLDAGDKHHASCVSRVSRLPKGPLRTTWAVLRKQCTILYETGGYRYQERLWKMRREGRLLLLEVTIIETDRMDALMAQYQNVPMDLADASLVAVAENRNFCRLFTIDNDFYIYRLADGSVLEILR